MTISVFGFKPETDTEDLYYIYNRNYSCRKAMVLLLVTNFVIFLGENIETFNSKVQIRFSSYKRIVALLIAFPMWIATLSVTIPHPGKELIWLCWVIFGICITFFQLINLFLHVIHEVYQSHLAKKAFSENEQNLGAQKFI
jgi:hypothetical protein